MELTALQTKIETHLNQPGNGSRTLVLDEAFTGIGTLGQVLADAGVGPALTLQSTKFRQKIAEKDFFVLEGEASLFELAKARVHVIFERIGATQVGLSLFCNVSEAEPNWSFTHSFPDLPTYINFAGPSPAERPSFLDDLDFITPFFIIATCAYTYDENQYHMGLAWDGGSLQVGLNFLAKLNLAKQNSSEHPLAVVAQVIGQDIEFDLSGTIHTQGDDPKLILTAAHDINKAFSPIAFEQVFITLYSGLDNTRGTTGYGIKFGLEVAFSDRFKLTLTADLILGYSELVVIRGQFESGTQPTLPGLGDLIKLTGGDDLARSLPSGLAEPSYFGINEFQLNLAPGQGKVTYAKVNIGTPQSDPNHHQWNWLDGSLIIKDLSLEWEMFFENQTVISLLISGNIDLGGGNIFVAANIPNLKNLRDYELLGALDEGDSIDLSQLLANITEKLSHPTPVPGNGRAPLKIDRLHLSAYPAQHTFSFDLDIENVCEFELTADTTIAITGIEMFVNSDGENRLAGFFEIAGYYITVVGTHTPNAGWQFEGSAGPVDMGALINDFATLFKITSVPAVLQSMAIKTLYVSFNTHSKDFSFTCDGTLTLNDDPKIEIEASIDIEITHQTDHSFEQKFGGYLTVTPEGQAPFRFDLIFDRQAGQGETEPEAHLDPTAQKATGQVETESRFVALYDNPNGPNLSIDTLLQTLGSGFPKTRLRFGLQDVVLATHTTRLVSQKTSSSIGQEATHTTSSYLFGLNIEGGLDLSGLGKLPLVGQYLRLDQSLVLGFQVLVFGGKDKTKQKIKTIPQADVDKFNALIDDKGFSLPHKDLNINPDLAVSLKMGNETRLLSLPISLRAGNTPLADQTVAQSNQPTANTGQSSADATGSDGVHWFKVQKSFGPVHFEQIGLKYAGGKLSGLLDGSLGIGGLTISLEGLTVTSPLAQLNPTFDLHGLGIDYHNGPVEIGAAFLRFGNDFAGLATVRTPELTLSAIGAYGEIEGHPSLFIYAVLNYPLGGPSFFFVTGLAGGFGYNRALIVPPIEQVAQFPFVAMAVQGPQPLPTDQAGRQATLTAELAKLRQSVYPELGQYFLAVGLKWTSFKLIDSFALLIVKFGSKFEIDLLGLSTVVSPPDAPEPLAEAQLALKATFIPDEGFLGVQAQLTSASFILSRNCHLTGGFAFFVWFSGPHAGDFVLTLGGYHPRFNKPAHYPDVPRLGLNWQVNPNLTIKGNEYYALTPHAFMAGGSLEATWQSGSVKAWFNAGADFMILWKPYHYDGLMYVDMGAEVTIHLFGTHHLSVDAGADLHLWGPEFAGDAHVHVKVMGVKVSFEVEFGGGASGLAPLDWSTFESTFLPANSVCSLSVQQGLIQEVKEGDTQRWIINPKDFTIASNSLIPINTATIGSTTIVDKANNNKLYYTDEAKTRPQLFQAMGMPLKQEPTDYTKTIDPPAIRPMAVEASKLATTHTIHIKRKDSFVETDFSYMPILKAVPAGLWGDPGPSLKLPEPNEKKASLLTLAGFEIRAKKPLSPNVTHDIDRRELQFETEPVQEAFRWETIDKFTADPELKINPELSPDQNEAREQQAWQRINSTIQQVKGLDWLKNNFGFDETDFSFGQAMDEDMLFAPLIQQ